MLRRDADKDLGVITDGKRLADLTTAHLRTSTRLTAAAASLPSCCDGNDIVPPQHERIGHLKPGKPFGSKKSRRTGLLRNAASNGALKSVPGRRARHL
jgi:hypothetical protein